MAQASIPVDLLNPGQVFGSLGFLEAADVLLGDAQGGFDWNDAADVRFRLCARGEDNPFAAVLSFVAQARVSSRAPHGSTHDTGSWQVTTEMLDEEAPFPFRTPTSPATLPAVLEGPGGSLIIDHWGDTTRRDAVKFWAGSGGYPGAALARDALDLVRDRCAGATEDPFNLSAKQSSSFRLDWRRDYIPIDLGFSLNNHTGRITAVGFPLVELFAAIGLGHARPHRMERLKYRYGAIGVTQDMASRGELFEPSLLRAALGAPSLPFSQRVFQMQLGWPGQEGQARAITSVTEEVLR